jgi:hypothetical protein
MRARALIGIAVGLTALASAAPSTALAALGVPGRESEPVVLAGADAPLLLGADPGEVVAFGYDGGWKQVPVQVDERAVVDYGQVRQIGNGYDHEAYTDPGTFAGADPDPTFDGGDEIAFMAKDAGAPADGWPDPAGVAPRTRTRVEISDPLDPAGEHAVYLFRSDGSLDPAAGRSYVDYDFTLDSGAYKATYDFNGVPNVEADAPPANPESSAVTTPAYTQSPLSRWVTDGLTLRTGAAPSPDLLDGDKAQVGRGCGRSELTFSRGGGGFIANISGPVRAIRSQIGANSGTYTQRDDIFYERRQDTVTYLRVHAGISQISQFRDYSPNAIGMTYRNSAYPAGVTIDGVPDAAIPVPPGSSALQPATDWEQVSGATGSIVTVTRVDTDLPGYTPGSFYRDQGSAPTFGQCGGYADYLSYGTSGNEFVSSGANTDPTLGSAYRLTGARMTFFDPPNGTAADAARRSDQVDAPLEAAVVEDPGPPVLRLRRSGRKRRIEPGGKIRTRVLVRNRGDATATGVEVCARVPERIGSAGRCRRIDALRADSERRVALAITARRRAKRSVPVSYRVMADNARRDRLGVRIPVRR